MSNIPPDYNDAQQQAFLWLPSAAQQVSVDDTHTFANGMNYQKWLSSVPTATADILATPSPTSTVSTPESVDTSSEAYIMAGFESQKSHSRYADILQTCQDNPEFKTKWLDIRSSISLVPNGIDVTLPSGQVLKMKDTDEVETDGNRYFDWETPNKRWKLPTEEDHILLADVFGRNSIWSLCLQKILGYGLHGYREDSSSRGVSGLYWSSSPSAANASTMYFTRTGVYPAYVISRSHHNSVRCLRD